MTSLRFMQQGAEPETIVLPTGAALHLLSQWDWGSGVGEVWERLYGIERLPVEDGYRWDDKKVKWVKKAEASS